MKLSKLDRKILYHLGLNARASYKELAQAIQSKKQIVAYHVKQLENKGIIWKYVPVIALNKINLNSHKIYFKLRGLDKKTEEKIINYLINDEETQWVVKCVGAWDLMISKCAENLNQFTTWKTKIFEKLSPYIQEYSIALMESALVFNRDYLLNKDTQYRGELSLSGEATSLDETERKILHVIRDDGRFNVTKVAQKLKLNVRTVMNRIKELENKKIISGYTCFLDINKLNLKYFKICIYFSDQNKSALKEVIDYAKMDPNVLHLITNIGSWELELELEAESVDSIYAFIKELKNKFPHYIKKIDLTIMTEELKLDFFPTWY